MIAIELSKFKLTIFSCLLLVLLFQIIQATYIYNFKYKNVYGYINLTAFIIDKYSEKEESITYLVALKDKNGERFKDKFLLYIKDSNTKYSYGDVLNICGNISIPKTLGNEGEFNYKNYLNSKQIVGNIYCNSYEYITSVKGNIFLKTIKSFKKYVSR